MRVADANQRAPRAWCTHNSAIHRGLDRTFARQRTISLEHRAISAPCYGQLRVSAVSRRDFILLKLFAMRATDVVDVESLQPPLTDVEVRFVIEQLPRIARTHARWQGSTL